MQDRRLESGAPPLSGIVDSVNVAGHPHQGQFALHQNPFDFNGLVQHGGLRQGFLL